MAMLMEFPQYDSPLAEDCFYTYAKRVFHVTSHVTRDFVSLCISKMGDCFVSTTPGVSFSKELKSSKTNKE